MLTHDTIEWICEITHTDCIAQSLPQSKSSINCISIANWSFCPSEKMHANSAKLIFTKFQMYVWSSLGRKICHVIGKGQYRGSRKACKWGRTGTWKLQPVDQIWPNVYFQNTVLLEHRHTLLLAHCLWPLVSSTAELHTTALRRHGACGHLQTACWPALWYNWDWSGMKGRTTANWGNSPQAKSLWTET